MNSIDQKVVEMKFDNSQFESAVSQTMSTLEKFKEKLNFKGSEKGLNDLSKSTSEYQYTLQDVGQSLANLEKRFGIVGTVGARIFEKLTDSAYGFVTKGINNIVSSITQGGMSRAMNLEQARFQMKGILGDAEKVRAVIYDYILPELQGTPYSLDQASVVISQLIASNKTSEEQIRRATRGIAGLAAMTNHSFADVGNIFTKVAGKGVMMAEELNQLSHYGINAAADLAKFYKGVEKGSYKSTKQTLKDMEAIKEAYGEFSEATIREAASKRLISYGSMAAAMDALYGPHAQKSIQMYTGALEDLKAAMARIGAEPAALKLNLFRDICNALVPAVDAVNSVIKPLWNSMRVLGDLDPDLEYVAPFKGDLAKRIQKVGWEFQKLFVQLDENNEIVRATKDSYEKLGLTWDKTDKVYKDLKTGLEYDEKQALMNPDMLRLITKTTQSVVNVVAALGKVVLTVGKGIRAAFPKVTLASIADVAERIEQFTANLMLSHKQLDRLKWFVRGLFTPLGLAVRGAATVIGLLISAFKTLLKVASPVFTVFNAFFGMLGRILSGLGNLVTNFARIIKGDFADATKEIREAEVWTNILSKLASVCNKIASYFDSIGIKVYAFLTNLHKAPAVQSTLTSLSTVAGALKTTFDIATDAVSKFIGGLKINDKITSFMDNIFGSLTGKGTDAAGGIGEIGTAFSKFGFYKSLVDLLSGSLGGLVGVLSGLGEFKPLKGIRKFFSELGDIIIGIGKSFIEGDFVVDRAKELFGWFGTYRKRVGQLTKGIIPSIKAFTETIPQILNFKDWGAILDSIAAHIKSAVDFIFKTLGLFGTGVAQDAAKGVENLATITKNIRASGENLAENPYLEPLKYFFEKISKSFKDWTSDMSPEKAKRLVIALAYFGTCLYYLVTINQAARAFRGLTTLANSFASIAGGIAKGMGLLVNSITGIFSALRGAARAVSLVVYMTALAVALVGIAAAMFIISKIDPSRLAAAAGIVLGAMIIIAGLMFGLNKVATKLGPATSKSLLMVAGVIAAIGFSMLAIAGSVKILTEVDQKNLWNAVRAILSIIAVFGLMMAGLGILPKMKANISTAAWALVGIAAGCRALVEAIKMLADPALGDEAAVDRAVSIIRKFLVFTGIFALLGGWAKHSFGAGFGIIGLALGIKLIIGSVIDLATELKPAEFKRAMTALKDIEKLILSFGGLMFAIGILNALSGSLSLKSGTSFTGGKGGGALVIAEIIAGIWIIAEAVTKLGQLTDAQIENGIRVLENFLTIVAIISLVSALGGMKVAAGAGAFAAVAAGLFLMAEGIVALGETEHFLAGFIKMFITFIGMIGAVMVASAVITRLADTMISVKAAAAVALLAASMLGFAIAIKMIADLPIEGLIVAVIGLVSIMAIAAGVMAVFAGASFGLLPIAGVLALFGAATLFVGAGIFLLTLALSALIPLILGLANVDLDQLGQGLEVLAVAAQGLADVFDIISGAAVRLAGALVLLGVGFLVVGIGALGIGVGFAGAAIGVFLLAGSLIVLYEVLSAFFPSVVQPVEDGMSAIINSLTNGFMASADVTRNGVNEIGNAAEESIDEAGVNATKTAEENSQNTADAMNPWNYFSTTDMDPEMAAYAEQWGGIPGMAGAEWTANEDQMLIPMGDTVVSADEMMAQWSGGGAGYGSDYMTNISSGIVSSSGKPVSALEMLFPGLKKVHDKMGQMSEKSGEAQAMKMGVGMDSKQKDVKNAATSLSNKAVPPSKYEESKSVGKGIGDGLIAGMGSKFDAVFNKALAIGNKAVQGAKQGADVNSPSKKTIPVGSSIGEGLIVGMANISGKVVAASEDLASEGIDALTNAMMSASKVFDSDLDFTPTISPVVDLTNVNQGVNDINGMFGRDFAMNSMFAGGRNAAFAAMGFQNQNGRKDELNKLVDSLNSMTDTMNSRSLNNYITVDGASDPEAFADDLIRSFRLNARTV